MDDRQETGLRIRLHLEAEVNAVGTRHVDVEHQQVRHLGVHQAPGRRAVRGLHHVVAGRLEDPGQNAPREVPKVGLVFASGERQDGKELTIVTTEMTLSMNEKANLRKFLESWRGKSSSSSSASRRASRRPRRRGGPILS